MTVIQSSDPRALTAGGSVYDDIINGTFANPAMQTAGWGKPVDSAPSYLRQGTSGVNVNPGVGFVPGAIPTSRLPQGTAGLPNPSPGSGLTPQQLQEMGGWAVDPRTGQLAYSAGRANPAVTAATGQAAGVPLPRARPPWAPTSIDMAAINGQQGANPGMGGEQGRAAGQTTLVDKLRAAGMSPSDAYAAANNTGRAEAQMNAGQGNTSWGGSLVGPGGESWAAGPRASGIGGGGDSLVSSGKPRRAINEQVPTRNMKWAGVRAV